MGARSREEIFGRKTHTHGVAVDLLALHKQANTVFELQLVELIAKLYGLLNAQELRLRVLSQGDI